MKQDFQRLFSSARRAVWVAAVRARVVVLDLVFPIGVGEVFAHRSHLQNLAVVLDFVTQLASTATPRQGNRSVGLAAPLEIVRRADIKQDSIATDVGIRLAVVVVTLAFIDLADLFALLFQVIGELGPRAGLAAGLGFSWVEW